MIINDIDTLKGVVKINASIPWEALVPYLNDALDIYIEPQVGNVIVVKAEEGSDATLKDKLVRVLGPLALALATDEMGIQYGDSGITVDNVQGKRSPASDAKIAAAKENLFFRGMQALDRLLDYLARKPQDYPDYADHVAIIGRVPCFIRSAQEYQDVGLVNIDYSTLTYRTMLPVLLQIQERHVREMVPEALCQKLLSANELSAKECVLREQIVRYLANRAAELYTSQSSHSERKGSAALPEFRPLIRPLYDDMQATGNFFGSQADFWSGKISAYLTENSEELGIAQGSAAINYNAKDKKLFTSIV